MVPVTPASCPCRATQLADGDAWQTPTGAGSGATAKPSGSLVRGSGIKLSSVISDLLGVSGRRILQAMADGDTNPERLAELGDDRLQCSEKELADALTWLRRARPSRATKTVPGASHLVGPTHRQTRSTHGDSTQTPRERGRPGRRNSRIRGGFRATNHRRNGGRCEHVPFSGRIRLLGRSVRNDSRPSLRAITTEARRAPSFQAM